MPRFSVPLRTPESMAVIVYGRLRYDPRPNCRGAAPGERVETPRTVRRGPGLLAVRAGRGRVHQDLVLVRQAPIETMPGALRVNPKAYGGVVVIEKPTGARVTFRRRGQMSTEVCLIWELEA